MSRGRGGGGRGGRGRGGGGGTGVRREMNALQTELLGKSLFTKNGEESGLFPAYEIPTGRASSREEKKIAALMDTFFTQLQESVFYLKPPPPPPEVERYSDQFYESSRTDQQSLKGLKTKIELFPEELHRVLLVKKRTKRLNGKEKVDGGAADGLEDVLKNAKEDNEEGGSDEEGNNEEIIEEEEGEDEEDGNDYMDTYFDNGEDDMGDVDEDEGGGGGDYY